MVVAVGLSVFAGSTCPTVPPGVGPLVGTRGSDWHGDVDAIWTAPGFRVAGTLQIGGVGEGAAQVLLVDLLGDLLSHFHGCVAFLGADRGSCARSDGF